LASLKNLGSVEKFEEPQHLDQNSNRKGTCMKLSDKRKREEAGKSNQNFTKESKKLICTPYNPRLQIGCGAAESSS